MKSFSADWKKGGKLSIGLKKDELTFSFKSS